MARHCWFESTLVSVQLVQERPFSFLVFIDQLADWLERGNLRRSCMRDIRGSPLFAGGDTQETTQTLED